MHVQPSLPLWRHNHVRGTPTRKRGARPRGKLSRQEASVFTLRPLVERRRTRGKHAFVSRISPSPAALSRPMIPLFPIHRLVYPRFLALSSSSHRSRFSIRSDPNYRTKFANFVLLRRIREFCDRPDLSLSLFLVRPNFPNRRRNVCIQLSESPEVLIRLCFRFTA